MIAATRSRSLRLPASHREVERVRGVIAELLRRLTRVDPGRRNGAPLVHQPPRPVFRSKANPDFYSAANDQNGQPYEEAD